MSGNWNGQNRKIQRINSSVLYKLPIINNTIIHIQCEGSLNLNFNNARQGSWRKPVYRERWLPVAFHLTPQPFCLLLGCSPGWSRGQGVKERPAGPWEGDHEVSRPSKQWRVCVCVCGSVGVIFEVRFRSGCLCTLRLGCAVEVKQWSLWGTSSLDALWVFLFVRTCAQTNTVSSSRVPRG